MAYKPRGKRTVKRGARAGKAALTYTGRTKSGGRKVTKYFPKKKTATQKKTVSTYRTSDGKTKVMVTKVIQKVYTKPKKGMPKAANMKRF